MKINFAISTLLLLYIYLPYSEASPNSERPNIVIFLTDDQGYGDLGITGNAIIDTPNIDQLFKQGVRFDRFYVSPVCSPTRASLLTGRAALSTGVFHVTRGGEKMRQEEVTLAEYLTPHGYKSGLFGKWHNGLQYPHNPLGQGFDEYYGFSDGHKTRYFDDQLQHNNKTVPFKGYIADALTQKAIDFIKENRNTPFFTLLSYNTPHGPFIAPEQHFAKYKKKGLTDLDASIYGMVENIDDNVAKVLATLAQLKLSDNTIVMYLSDNGPAFPKGIKRYNAGMKGHKGVVDEGGVRSPMAIHWPSKILSGHTVPYIAQHIDIVPTILDITGIKAPEGLIHGKSLLPLLKEPSTRWPDRNLYTHRFQISKDSSRSPIHLAPGAIRSQTWLATLNESNTWRLYNIENDPTQKHDLSSRAPEQLAAMQTQYIAWFKQQTKAHGPYTTLAIEVGHPGYSRIEFPAHEGLIQNEGLRYQYYDGWAHDWITNETNTHSPSNGTVNWPIKSVNQATFDVYVGYGTPHNTFKGELTLSLGNHVINKVNLAPYIPSKNPSPRQFYTSEAADYQWKKLKIGEVTLRKDQVSQISLSTQSAKASANNILWIKYLELIEQ